MPSVVKFGRAVTTGTTSSGKKSSETDTKKQSYFAKLQILNDKIDQNLNFAKFSSAKWLFCTIVNFITTELMCCEIVQLVCESLSLIKR